MLAGSVALPSDVSAALAAAAGAPVGALRVHTVHLDHADAAARAAQGREVASLAMLDAVDEAVAVAPLPGDAAVTLPVVVAGDFNAREGTEPLLAMTDSGFVEASGSAGTTRIDHVFVHRSAAFVARERRAVFTGASAVSDHPGVLVRFEASPPKLAKLTHIAARGSFPIALAVRGDHAPLSWERGWPAFPLRTAAEPTVTLVTSELPAAPFAYKFLRADQDWQTGENVTGSGHAPNATTPTFP
jgi:hypothetical protein